MLPADFKNIYIKEKKESFNLIGRIKIKVLILAAIAVAFLFSAQLVLANNLATDGQKVSQIEDQINHLEQENTTLRAGIAQESSLSYLSQKAKDLGFDTSKK